MVSVYYENMRIQYNHNRGFADVRLLLCRYAGIHTIRLTVLCYNAPAAITAPSPIRTPFKIIAFIPIQTLSSMNISAAS